MNLSAEKAHLLQKRLHQAHQPASILAAATLSTITFTVVYWCSCFEMRYSDKGTVTLIVAIFAALAVILTFWAGLQYRQHKPCRGWIGVALALWGGLVTGYSFGDRYWYEHTISYYNIQDMGSYVNIDPYLDKGASFMDAGTMYFKEGSVVLREKALAFKNGLTYCVAPIVRAPIEASQSSDTLQTLTGFAAPASGTVDFWAVGTECCDRDASSFDCGEVSSKLARSGLRLLDQTSRSMYLLAVQEWSATTGLPVRHPLFFEWVKDPILHQEKIYEHAIEDIRVYATLTFFISLVLEFCVHSFLQKWRVH